MEQCSHCGGVWADPREAFRAHRESASEVERIDENLLAEPVALNHDFTCPKDGSVLNKLTDTRLPEHLEVDSCPTCQGIWFNHGEFTSFQEHRSLHLNAINEKTTEQFQALLAHESDEAGWKTVRSIGETLSRPVHRPGVFGTGGIRAAPDLDIVFKETGEIIFVLIGTIIRVLLGIRLP
jgi:Zn-finger nucleic acid-binding protein